MYFIRKNLTDSLKLDNMNNTSTLVLKLPANLSQLFNQLKSQLFNQLLKITQTEILIML